MSAIEIPRHPKISTPRAVCNKCSDRRSMEENYDRPTNRPTYRLRDKVKWKFHFQFIYGFNALSYKGKDYIFKFGIITDIKTQIIRSIYIHFWYDFLCKAYFVE